MSWKSIDWNDPDDPRADGVLRIALIIAALLAIAVFVQIFFSEQFEKN